MIFETHTHTPHVYMFQRKIDDVHNDWKCVTKLMMRKASTGRVEGKVELFCGGRCGGAQPVAEERDEGGVVGG